MKKNVSFILGLFTFTLLVFSLNVTQKQSWVNLYHSYNRVSIVFPRAADNAIDMEALFYDLHSFSNEHNINILQFHFRSEHDVDVFASNILADRNFKDSIDTVPTDSFYLSTRSHTTSFNNIGSIYSPWANFMDVRLYELSHVASIHAFSGYFLMNGDQDQMMLFESYGVSTISWTNI